MANPDHVKVLSQGVEAWNQWREENPEIRPDLSHFSTWDLKALGVREPSFAGANFRDATLWDMDAQAYKHWFPCFDSADFQQAYFGRANLRYASLRNANLRHAGLGGTNFDGANLNGAILHQTHLHHADFVHAELDAADLSSAHLIGAHFHETSLRRANFSGATVGETDFSAIDLSDVYGLDTVEHNAPSTIGVDTIYKSRGKIPEAFLRGCGLPDEFIAYIGSLVGRPIEYYSCFISYSSKDQAFADRLYADLQAKGVRCWFAPHDIRGGRKIHEQLDEAIRLHDKLLLILSESSMASDWVRLEIVRTLKREAQEKRQMLFPVTLVPFDPVIKQWEKIGSDGKDLAEEIRQYPIPDFSNWKDHNSYQKAFTKLVADLKAQS